MSYIIIASYADDIVRTSFKIKHEKIPIRAFREGLKSPLKERIINFEAKTLEELTKKAIEEEPFVNVLKPSTVTTDDGDNTNETSFWERKNHRFNNGRFNNSNYNQTNSFARRNWRDYSDENNQNRNFNFQQRNGNPFQRNGFHDMRSMNTMDVRSGNFNKFDNKNTEVKICLRCNKRGHNSDTCYVRLVNNNNGFKADDANVVDKMKQVSFLDAPKNWQPMAGNHRNEN